MIENIVEEMMIKKRNYQKLFCAGIMAAGYFFNDQDILNCGMALYQSYVNNGVIPKINK